MNGQQAPAPSHVQAEPSKPSHVALTNAHETTPDTSVQVIQMPISVRMVLPIEEKRFCRTQAMGPAVLTGGRIV